MESPSDAVYTPPIPHINEGPDALTFLAIEPSDVNLPGLATDRSRVEIKVSTASSGPHVPFQAHNGEVFRYAFRLRFDDVLFSRQFSHLHQISSSGGGANDGSPLITLTFTTSGEASNFKVRYLPDTSDTSAYVSLGTLPIASLNSRWINFTEVVKFGQEGSYSLEVRPEGSPTPILRIDRALPMIRVGTGHYRPKFGIYRKKDAALRQGLEKVHFSNISISNITASGVPDATCRKS